MIDQNEKDKILYALTLGLDCARQLAQEYHLSMAGYRKHRHKQMDDDVKSIELALSIVQEL